MTWLHMFFGSTAEPKLAQLLKTLVLLFHHLYFSWIHLYHGRVKCQATADWPIKATMLACQLRKQMVPTSNHKRIARNHLRANFCPYFLDCKSRLTFFFFFMLNSNCGLITPGGGRPHKTWVIWIVVNVMTSNGSAYVNTVNKMLYL